ncbi:MULTISPECIES: energy-coupling factor transporter transmembrane component T family protein [Pseudonocardia]|uniref:Energy-coupling factor transporter transmembrane protein EcfT n=2 Tax=Pseudonocardia TaxID=1847 RepID=A0A1Y2N796_PSEAH|nr:MULTISPECIES: energy-coupling factor transporter transmembrane protein EcfT [Pseudonocardia]OSY42768.1 Energy-coupling factor transporter transmembrane protein EcfT [Pseudonocardia autotrophica]TDN77345.1 energy-coupling factor transporter transmembrane protein EcfT [Pseudonocardia autotrophica]BBG01367.1 hypothetical protein Pdca_25760 [Pseudonocardia autotrophica]GEC24423.1 hypothetical protein PSA01_14520 [Pseudonocardia saturnea]
MSAPAGPRRPVVLRPLPGGSPVHELWAGTKLIVIAAMGLLLALFPGWVPIGLVAVFLFVGLRAARVPRTAMPTVPRWLWLLLALSGATVALAGGAPWVDLGVVRLGFGGLLDFLRLMSFILVLLVLSVLVAWTTDPADVAPALARLGRPLKVLRLPVDDWAVTLALTLRALPMLLDELRVLFAARRLRPRPPAATRRRRYRRWAADQVDLIATAMTVALRRADEMGDAITARGGSGRLAARPSRPGAADALVLGVVGIVCALSVHIELIAPLGSG